MSAEQLVIPGESEILLSMSAEQLVITGRKFVALFLATHFSPGAMISLPGRHDLAGPDLG